MLHAGFHDPSVADKRRAEINRLRRRIARYDAELAKLEGSPTPIARATRRAIRRSEADAVAYLEHLEDSP